MRRYFRVICLFFALLLTVGLVSPTPVESAATASEIEQQIRQIYRGAQEVYGRSSFHGYCGSMVNAELYLMGINTSLVRNHGNTQYDCYSAMTITSGGYRVRAYPPSSYTLEEALNAISENGTKDVYNILVGFQATRTSAGSRYGHAVVINAILDGTVIFMESFDMTMNGKRHPEGTPIKCSIADFAAYYKRTTVSLDGVIYFGTKSYADLCRVYPSYLTAVADAGADIRTQPCEASVDGSSEHLRTLTGGEELTVTGLYLNTDGEYWYQLDGGEGYVRASQLQVSQFRYDDLAVTDPTAPGVLRVGKGFNVEGTLSAQYNSIYTVRAQVARLEEQTETPAISASTTVDGKRYDLKSSEISNDLTFRMLETGSYRYDLAAIVDNYYYDRGQLQIEWKTVSLWSSDFQIVEGSASYHILSFDSDGGSVEPDQMVVTAADPVGSLPVPQMEGQVFLGWYTEDGQQVDGTFVPEVDLTLRAKWISEQELYEAWQTLGQCRYFHSDGSTTTGCFEMDGTLYYFSSVDAAGQSWTIWTVAEAV